MSGKKVKKEKVTVRIIRGKPDDEAEDLFYDQKCQEAKEIISDWFPGDVEIVTQTYGTSGEFKIMVSNLNLQSGALVHENRWLKQGFVPGGQVKTSIAALLAGKTFDEQSLGLAKKCEDAKKVEEDKAKEAKKAEEEKKKEEEAKKKAAKAKADAKKRADAKKKNEAAAKAKAEAEAKAKEEEKAAEDAKKQAEEERLRLEAEAKKAEEEAAAKAAAEAEAAKAKEAAEAKAAQDEAEAAAAAEAKKVAQAKAAQAKADAEARAGFFSCCAPPVPDPSEVDDTIAVNTISN